VFHLSNCSGRPRRCARSTNCLRAPAGCRWRGGRRARAQAARTAQAMPMRCWRSGLGSWLALNFHPRSAAMPLWESPLFTRPQTPLTNSARVPLAPVCDQRRSQGLFRRAYRNTSPVSTLKYSRFATVAPPQ
jgi:hypothetical protein